MLTLLLACSGAPQPDSGLADRGPVPHVEPPAPVLKRLTQEQYRNALGDLFTQGLVLPSLEPDEEIDGLFALGAGLTSISPYGVEQYEGAAYDVAEQVMDDPELRAGILGCEPEATVDTACASSALAALARRAWRRPVTEDEVQRLTALADAASETLDDFDDGFEFGIAAVLQSPYFLYRVELGEDDGEGGLRYSDVEMATRLAFFLWNTLPDEELLLAAEAGELTTDAGLEEQVVRMLADDKARQGMRAFFTELYELHQLDEMSKDPNLFVNMSEELGPSAREETLLLLEYLIFDQDADFRELFTTRTTFLDRELAMLYDVPAPSREGFGQTMLPADEGRRGLLGHVSVLAGQSHAVSTSVTLRGLFIRERMLCVNVDPPPADVDASIPEPDADAPTMRERVAVHLEEPFCAGCHQITDPIGLGLENFDGIGRWRLTENGATIDPSGELDGAGFEDAWGLGEALGQHPNLGPCLTEMLMQYSDGQHLDEGEEDLADWHAQGFAASGHSVLWLMQDIALSPGFRRTGEVL